MWKKIGPLRFSLTLFPKIFPIASFIVQAERAHDGTELFSVVVNVDPTFGNINTLFNCSVLKWKSLRNTETYTLSVTTVLFSYMWTKNVCNLPTFCSGYFTIKSLLNCSQLYCKETFLFRTLGVHLLSVWINGGPLNLPALCSFRDLKYT